MTLNLKFIYAMDNGKEGNLFFVEKTLVFVDQALGSNSGFIC